MAQTTPSGPSIVPAESNSNVSNYTESMTAGPPASENGAPAPNLNASGSNSIAVSDNSGVRSFVAQKFSASTEMILKRLRGESGSFNPIATLGFGGEGKTLPPGYENVKRSVLEGMKTTFNMELPPTVSSSSRRTSAAQSKSGSGTNTPRTSTPATAAKTGAAPKTKSPAKASRGKAGKKRKRRDDSDSADESTPLSGLGDTDSDEEYTTLPTKTLSGRKVVKPAHFDPAKFDASDGSAKKRQSTSSPFKRSGRSMEQALCKRCSRGISPAGNMIVFCDGCNQPWHQMCHDPKILDDLVKDESKEWFCQDCAAKRAQKLARSSAPAASQASPNQSAIPTVNGNWQGKSIDQKRAYLSTFPQAHLIHLLLQAEIQHPDISIYPPATPSNSSTPPAQQQQQQPNPQRRINVHPQQPFPPSAAAGLFTRAEANPNATINFIRKISPPATTSASGIPESKSSMVTGVTSALQHSASAPPEIPTAVAAANERPQGETTALVARQDSRESTPASPPYPKPGTGFMADLPPDEEDLDWLVGDEEEPAFSHMVFIDERGRMQKTP